MNINLNVKIKDDGDYICQNTVRNIQNFINTYGLTDENGDAIEFESKEIYKG